MPIKQTPLSLLRPFTGTTPDRVAHLVHIKSVQVHQAPQIFSHHPPSDYMILEVSDGTRTMPAYVWSTNPAEIKVCQNSKYAMIEGYIQTFTSGEQIYVTKLTLSPLPYTADEIVAWTMLWSVPSKASPVAGPKSCVCSMKDLLSRGCSCGGC